MVNLKKAGDFGFLAIQIMIKVIFGKNMCLNGGISVFKFGA